MPTFEMIPRFERDWKKLTAQQQATFRKVVTEAFVPDLAASDRPFRPGLHVKGVVAHPGVFEMTTDNDGVRHSATATNELPARPTSSGGGSEPTRSSRRRPAHSLIHAGTVQNYQGTDAGGTIMTASITQAS